MRRGLTKDLANTPTHMACGWQLHADLTRLATQAGGEVTINLLDGTCTVNNTPLTPPLHIANATHEWFRRRLANDNVPDGYIHTAYLTLRPLTHRRRITITCTTIVTSERGSHTSENDTTW